MILAWMQTHSGKPFDLLNPRSEDVDREDVIHHLARLARFSGATKGAPYYVLQHCLLVMEILEAWGAPPVIVYEGGWHECDEPYTGDLTRPVQLAIKEIFETQIQAMFRDRGLPVPPSASWPLDPMTCMRRAVGAAARDAFGLPPQETPIVKRADNVALAIERRDLMAPCAEDWKLAEYAPPGITIRRVMDSDEVETAFRVRMSRIEDMIKEGT